MKISLLKMIFRKFRKIMVSMIMIAALASSLMNGMINTYQSLDVTMKKYLADYGISDAVITTDLADTGVAEKIRQVEGVDRVIARLTGASQMLVPSGLTYTVQIISLDNREDFLRLHYWEELDQFSGDYVLLDYWFAENTGISVGDTVHIHTARDGYRPFIVAAIVSAPETMEKTKLDFGGKTYPDFGFLYAPISLLETETEKESARLIAEWKEKETEYLQARRDAQKGWDEGQAELARAWEELEKQEKEFEEKRTELKEQIRQLVEGRLQLMLGRRELDQAAESAGERKEQLNQTLNRMSRQVLETEDTIAELTEARNDMNSLTVQLEIAKGQLSALRNRIVSAAGKLRTILSYANRALDLVEDLQSGLPEEIADQKEKLESMLSHYGLSIGDLKEWISRGYTGLSQMETAKSRIQNGIAQINRDYLPEVQKYLKAAEQGLETAYGIQESLKTGVAGIESGLKAIADFEREAPDNRKEISQRLSEAEEALQEIYGGIEEAEKALSEGRETLEGKDSEAQEAYSKAEHELEEGARSLQEAWDEIISWEGYTPLRNEFLIWFREDVTDPQAVLLAAEAAVDVPVQSGRLYDDSEVANAINNELTPLSKMSVAVPLLFVGIMMMVLFLFLSIMIRQSRHSIGILRALGFSRGQVRGSYCMVCLIMLTLASVLGGALSIGITSVFSSIYQEMFNLATYIRVFSWPVFGLTSGAVILLGVSVVALSTRAMNRIQPAEAISRPTAAAPKVGPWTRMLLSRVEPLSKFSLLSLARNPFRFFSSVLCLGGAVSILFGALCFLVAKNEVIIQVFDHQLRYDAQIVFAQEPEEALDGELRRTEWITAAERYWAGEESITFAGATVHATLMFLAPDTEMVSLSDLRGNPMSYPAEGIVLAGGTAEALGVKAGDLVDVGGTETRVTGISRQMGMSFQYLPATEKDRYRVAQITGWLIRVREESEASGLVPRLVQEDGYVTTQWCSLMRKGYTDLFVAIDLYGWLLVLLCGMVGLCIVVNTGQNNLNEQRLSLSVLRTLGFQHREISRRWFLQSLLYYLLSLTIGYPLGRLVGGLGLELLKQSERYFVYVSSPYQYVWTAVTVFVFVLIGHLITVHSMKKWNLVEETKGRE